MYYNLVNYLLLYQICKKIYILMPDSFATVCAVPSRLLMNEREEGFIRELELCNFSNNRRLDHHTTAHVIFPYTFV